MGNISDIIKAMGAVPDVDIDPNTGATRKRSDKSLLEKSGIQLDEETKQQIIEKNKKNQVKKQESYNTVKTYKEMMNIPIVEQKEDPNDDGLLHAGENFDEDYIQLLVKRCKKR